ncbi:unnamed protein product [Notodromas monacha]|uniref:1-alkyl-2-acetylglycerophosphocholine esterase n=1 Tax=Notodromas monacha TaxID=399045 RepID=A0A7R9BPP8_9CRUS|nr:unnamed protein product [Notodromas monacha]CAG0918536.1 unnamed protein product [Notodromas monacha]
MHLNGFGLGTQYLPLFTQEPCATSGDDGNEENAKRKFPVVVFSHGLGQCRSSYSVLCSHLASHGFVVAAIEHRGLNAIHLNQDFCPSLTEQTLRTSQLRQRADEVSRCVEFLRRLNDGVLKRDSFYAPRPGDSAKWGVLRSLAGRLDMSRLLLSGHSMGGVTTMKVLSKENDLFRYRCGIALDPWMYALRTEADDLFPKIGKSPLLCITMEAFQNLPNQKCLGKLLALAPEDAHREIITIKGSVHESQADAPFMSNQSAISRIVSRYLIGPPSVTDHELIMDINVALMLKFASQFLEMEKFEDAEAELKENEDLLRKGLIMDVDHEKPRIIHKL